MSQKILLRLIDAKTRTFKSISVAWIWCGGRRKQTCFLTADQRFSVQESRYRKFGTGNSVPEAVA